MDNEGFSCFFISPIGKENSKERFNSDMVIETLLTPVLMKHGLSFDGIHSIRADQGSSLSITSEMLRHLREDRLCIADITGHNPNVMWECGFREACGKPLIVISSDENRTTEKVFDMYDKRTVHYNFFDFQNERTEWQNADRRRRICEELEKQISHALSLEAEETTSVPVGALERIEEKLEEIKSIVVGNAKTAATRNNDESTIEEGSTIGSSNIEPTIERTIKTSL